MGILDDAIREHLDLKRQHGARDADLREIEDEAFGSTDRPDPFAPGDLFNEASATGTAEAERGEAPSPATGEPDLGGEEPTRLVEPSEPISPPEPISPDPISPPEGLNEIPGQVELPGQDEIPGQESFDDDPLEGYQPSSEPVIEPAPETDAPDGPETSESLEELIAEEEPFPEDPGAARPAPPDDTGEHFPPEDNIEPLSPEDPVAPPAPSEPEESDRPLTPEPESVAPDPPPPPPDTGPEPPGRARGRVDVPTQEHPPPGDTGGVPPVPPPEEDLEPLAEEPSGGSGGPALYDFETDEDSLTESPAPAPPEDDFEALGPAEEEAPYLDEEEPYADAEETPPRPAPADEPGTEVRPALEDEEAYEGGAPDPEESWEEEEEDSEEGLWFEKGPPKDFDFD
jgi:hypothetical protein